MIKNILFNIEFGSSGNMLLGSMLDLGMNFDSLMQELTKLGLENWTISPKKIIRNSISGTLVNVKCMKIGEPNRNLSDIKNIIEKSGLSDKIKEKIIKVFQRLAKAEASVHDTTIEKIHFHEVGAIDSIIDISAFCISLDILEIKNIYFTDFNLGCGSIQCSHNELPVPVPAVVELINGFKCRTTDRVGEINTPTSVAILTTLGKQIETTSSYTILNNGTSFGTRDYPFPNMTRAFLIGQQEPVEEIQQIECNIDDMNPQIYPYLIEEILKNGALDAYTTPLSMKKGRPGTLLTVIAQKEAITLLKEIIFRETSTMGLRIFNPIREKLNRKFDTIPLYNHSISIKIGYLNDKIVNIQPEFEDCKKIAQKKQIPLNEIINMAREEYCNKKIK